MINKALTEADLIVVMGSLFFSIYTVGHNVWAYRRGLRELRFIIGRTAAFAIIYATAYGILIFTDIDRLKWSTIMIGVSWTVWLVIWNQTANWSVKERKRLNKALAEMHERLGGQQ